MTYVDPWHEPLDTDSAAPPDTGNDVPSLGPTPTHALDADITLYWPRVRPCREPTR